MQVANDLSDVKSLDGEGAYFRVLRFLWLNGPQPIEQLRRKCQHVFDELEHLFINCSTDAEQLFSVQWLEAQRAKADEWRANKREAGLKSAELRASKSKTKNRRSTAVEQPTSTSISNSTSTEEEVERAKNEKFEALWQTYEGKGAKGKAREYWAKLTEEDRGAILAKAPAYVASTSGADLAYRKNLEGWINPAERRWEAPIISRKVEAPKPKVWTKAEAIEEVRRIRDLHGKDFQTHHVPNDVLQAYRQPA